MGSVPVKVAVVSLTAFTEPVTVLVQWSARHFVQTCEQYRYTYPVLAIIRARVLNSVRYIAATTSLNDCLVDFCDDTSPVPSF